MHGQILQERGAQQDYDKYGRVEMKKIPNFSPARLSRLSLALLFAATFGVAVHPATIANDARSVTETRAHPIGNAIFQGKFRDTETLDIVVGLRLRNPDKLEQLLISLGTPDNPAFGHWLTPAQLLADYAPTEAQAQAVANHLARSGFYDIQIASNRLLVTASGSAAAVRTAFKTELAHFVRDGRDAIANLTDVTVPSELASIVLSVLGLQTLDLVHVGTVQAHNPVQFPVIYDASSLASATKTAVGIITDGNMTPVISDLHKFEGANSLPQITPTVVNVGGTSSDTSNTVEWDLDSQDIQSMAGGTLKQMLFYTATALTDAALTPTYNKAVTDNIATVINVSLGECESSANSDGAMAQDDAIFKLAVAQGQTFSVSSGDSGSNECGSGGVSYPASSPYVIAVGGTTLSTNANGTYASETAWSGSGGGPSAYEAQPNWQNGIVPGTKRGVPDIAFDANPSSGAQIIVNGTTQTWGGTSLASPLFVGSWARLQSLHNNALGFPGSWIYQYGNKRPASAFHDVTTGSNGGYTASVGWDYTTGWGSFDVAAVNSVVGGVGSPPAEPVEIVPNYPPVQFTNDSVEPVSVTPATSGAHAASFNFCKTDDLRGQSCHTSTTPSYTFTLRNGSTNTFQAQACNTAGCSGFIVSPTTVTYCQNYSCP